MEFDRCSRTDEYAFKFIESKFKQAGYSLPKLTFWNLNSRSNAIPLIENNLGVALVSGYSPANINAVMSGRLDPYEALMDCIFVERYDEIADTIKDYARA